MSEQGKGNADAGVVAAAADNPEVVIAGGEDTGTTATGADAGADDVASVEREALASGWVPQDKWTGDPKRWRDAASFVDARNHILPLVRKENESLRREQAELKARLERFEQKEREQEAARETLTIETLKLERKQALENQDYGRVSEIDERLIAAAAKDAVTKAQPKQNPAQQQIDPQIQETWNQFVGENEWVKSEKAQAVLMEKMVLMRQAGSSLVGRAMLDEAKDRIRREYPEWFPSARRAGMAESGGYNGAARSNTRTWNDLKPEVKQALDEFIESTPGMTREALLKRAAQNPSEYFRR